MTSGYATTFVETVLEETPPLSLRVEQLNDLADDGFEAMIEHTLDGAISTVSDEQILEETDIDSGAILDSIQEYLIVLFTSELGGEISVEQMKEQLEDQGLSESRADYTIDRYNDLKEDIRNALLFRYVNYVYTQEVEDLKDNQREIILLLRELLEELRSIQTGDDSDF